MRFFKTIILFVALIISIIPKIRAQVFQDAGMWNTISLENKLTSKFSAIIEEEFRLKENFSSLNLFYTNVGLTCKLIKSLKIGLIYRNIQKIRDDNSFSYRSRLMFDISLKQKDGFFIFSYRHRLQAEVRNVYTSENGKYPEYYSRNKFEIKYDFGKTIIPYSSIELRYQINDLRNPESDGVWHRARFVFGAEYNINDKSTTSVYYLIQNEWNVSEPENLYIIGLQYAINL